MSYDLYKQNYDHVCFVVKFMKIQKMSKNKLLFIQCSTCAGPNIFGLCHIYGKTYDKSFKSIENDLANRDHTLSLCIIEFHFLKSMIVHI